MKTRMQVFLTMWLVGTIAVAQAWTSTCGSAAYGAFQAATVNLEQNRPSHAPIDQDPSGLSSALDVLFNPQRAPERRTMGLLQRSFLDLVEQSQARLQVALVIDGTESMASDMAQVRKSLNSLVQDLRRYRGQQVEFAVVIYRDLGAPSGSVSLPLPRFTADANLLAQVFDEFELETGAPYFPEAVDVGVHAALQRLAWDSDPDVTRWIMLFGDAPPYDPDFVCEQTGARRHFDTDLLVDMANQNSIRISCILCRSASDFSSFEQAVDKTRTFMNDLATGTGGLMLDLSYPDIHQVIAEAAQQPAAPVQQLGRITRADIEAARREAQARQSPLAESRRIRIAVLPHLPLRQMHFAADRPEVKLATELREKLRQLPGVEVASKVNVERHWERLSRRAGAGEGDLETETGRSGFLQALTSGLGVDYVVWGDYRGSGPTAQVDSAIFAREHGRAIARGSLSIEDPAAETQLTGLLLEELIASLNQEAPESHLGRTLGDYWDQAAAESAGLSQPISSRAEVRDRCLVALAAMEEALEFPAGDRRAVEPLQVAQRELEAALEAEPLNPRALLWLANCYFNQAQLLLQFGDSAEANRKLEQAEECLKRAFRLRLEVRDEDLRQEILGDYALLVQRDAATAADHYKRLVDSPSARLKSALRGHWMLAGIYSGEWGAAAELTQPATARQHLIQILAHWEESQEAKFVRHALRWADDAGQNQYDYFPAQLQMVLATRSED